MRISDAVADTAPAVRELMQGLAGFKDSGKRMMAAWSEAGMCSARFAYVRPEPLDVVRLIAGFCLREDREITPSTHPHLA